MGRIGLMGLIGPMCPIRPICAAHRSGRATRSRSSTRLWRRRGSHDGLVNVRRRGLIALIFDGTVLTQFWSRVDYRQLSQCRCFVSAKAGNRSEPQITRGNIPCELNLLWRESRTKLTRPHSAPDTAIVAHIDFKGACVSLVLAMVLPRHQHQSTHLDRGRKGDVEFYRIANLRLLISRQNKCIWVAINQLTRRLSVDLGCRAELLHDARIEEKRPQLSDRDRHLRLKTIAGDVIDER